MNAAPPAYTERAKSPTPTKSPARAKTPVPTKSPSRAKSPAPTKSPARAKSPVPTAYPERTKSPAPSKSSARAKSPAPTKSPARAKSPAPTASPDLKAIGRIASPRRQSQPLPTPASPPPPTHRDDFDASKHTKHHKFWFYDGSVVLNVENTLFRVHKAILSTHCEVFETLFSIPQQASLKEERIEGCPVVRLAGDKPGDMNDLLSALYFPSHFDQLQIPSAEPHTMITFISGILRLSTKYLNPLLRTRCISILHTYIPTTHPSYDSPPVKRRLKSDELMLLARLARETNVPTILPYLFYCIARLSPARILKDDPNDISWRDKTIAQIGRERLRHAEMSMSHSFLLGFVPSPNCKTLFLCSAARGPHTAWHHLDGSGKSANPLKEFVKWKDMNVCEECVELCKKMHEEGRTAVWNVLPALFEMEGWEVLREREGESLDPAE
ncbi:hypothetical protein PM082_020151 [Marasmius tenuissimus]|nr:hypothetical protein PM082_020151 [Marasmius tenuissimus]